MNTRPRMSKTQKTVLIFILLFPIFLFAELLQSAARAQRDTR
jgi:hypothetical protein